MQTKSASAPARAVGESIARMMPNVIQGIHLNFVAKHAITHRQFLVLVAIHSHGKCEMGRLSKDLHVTMPTTTGIVDRLVKSGYVRRVADTRDRRQVFIELSVKGRRFIGDFQGAVAERWTEILSAFPREEVARFSRAIGRIAKALCLCFLLFGAATARAEEMRPLSLSGAVSLARERPLELIVADERVKESLAQLAQARSLFVPKVDGLASQSRQTRNLRAFGIPSEATNGVVGPFNSFEAKLKAEQIVFDAAAVARLLAVSEGVRLSKTEKRKAREDAMALVGALYLKAFLSRQQDGFMKTSLELNRAALRLAHRRLRNGQAVRADILEAKTAWKRARSQLFSSGSDHAENLRGLAVALGMDPETPIELALKNASERVALPDSEDLAVLLDQSPDIESAKSLLRQRKRVRIAQWAEYFPKLSLLAEYGATGMEPADAEETYFLGVKASVPFFDGGERAARAREAEARERESSAALSHTEREIKADILNGQQSLLAAEHRLEAEELGVLSARQRQAEMDERKKLGMASAWDSLYAAFRMEESSLRHDEAGVQYLLSVISLLRSEGRMELLASKGQDRP